MKNTVPCTIRHLNLDGEGPVPGLTGSPACHLLVFWWKNVPLGQVFAFTADEEGMRRLAVQTISRAIRFYGKSASETDEVLQCLMKGDNAGFRNRMTGMFQNKPAPGFSAGDVSVVICTRNRSVSLGKCLEALSKQQDPPLEILVVDNAPQDDRTRLTTGGYPGVDYYPEPRPGLDIARNTGMRKSRGRIIAYTDDDTLPYPSWVSAIAGAFTGTRIMAVTGLVLAHTLDTQAQLIFETYWSFNRGFTRRIYDRDYFTHHLERGVPVWEIGAGANMAFRREIFSLAGDFDERLDVGAAGCSGDSEYWYRILAEGYDIAYEPRAVVLHDHRKEMHQLRKQIYGYMRGFTAALLIQHEKYAHPGNLRRIYRNLPPYYLGLLTRGIVRGFRSRYSTVWAEIRGCLSGMNYYRKHKISQPDHEMKGK